MSKHTPGPWIGAGPSFGDPLPRYTKEIMTEHEDVDGDVETICILPFNHKDEKNEANARLIAAAPDLLESLQECLGVVEGLEQKAGIWRVIGDKARAAIAKATGEANA